MNICKYPSISARFFLHTTKHRKKALQLGVLDVQYQPPEFFSDKPVDDKADMWGLGMLMFQVHAINYLWPN